MLSAKLVGFQLKQKATLPSAFHSCGIGSQNYSEVLCGGGCCCSVAWASWCVAASQGKWWLLCPLPLPLSSLSPVDLPSKGQEKKFSGLGGCGVWVFFFFPWGEGVPRTWGSLTFEDGETVLSIETEEGAAFGHLNLDVLVQKYFFLKPNNVTWTFIDDGNHSLANASFHKYLFEYLNALSLYLSPVCISFQQTPKQAVLLAGIYLGTFHF